MVKAVQEKKEGDIYLGQCAKTNKNVIISAIDRFGHFLIVGPTRSGKTSKVIKPCIWQDLTDIKLKELNYEIFLAKEKIKALKLIKAVKSRKHLSKEKISEKVETILEKYNETIDSVNKQRYKAGLSIIEPKGDLCEDVKEMCETLEIKYTYLNPLDPNTHKYNILQGDPEVVAETMRTVLRNLFGKQEPFFAQVQETTARNTVLLIKKILGDNIDLVDITRALRDNTILKQYVEKYEDKYGKDDLVEFYQSEVFGTLKDKFYQFAMGLRQQLEDISMNKHLQRVMVGKSDINLDEHLENGGVLICNTAMGKLGKLGDVFGQFMFMNIQNAVFRRDGNEFTRAFHYLWVDEAPRYMNPDLERLLAIGGSFRCSTNLAVQTISQLSLEGNEKFTNIAMANCRNKVLFAGLPSEEAKLFESEFGQEKVTKKQHTYEYRNLLPFEKLLPKAYRKAEEFENRFDFTDIIELKSSYKWAEALVRYYSMGQIQPPVKIITRVGNYSRKPKEILDKEKELKKLKLILDKFEKVNSKNKSFDEDEIDAENDCREEVNINSNIKKNIFKKLVNAFNFQPKEKEIEGQEEEQKEKIECDNKDICKDKTENKDSNISEIIEHSKEDMKKEEQVDSSKANKSELRFISKNTEKRIEKKFTIDDNRKEYDIEVTEVTEVFEQREEEITDTIPDTKEIAVEKKEVEIDNNKEIIASEPLLENEVFQQESETNDKSKDEVKRKLKILKNKNLKLDTGINTRNKSELIKEETEEKMISDKIHNEEISEEERIVPEETVQDQSAPAIEDEWFG